MKPETSAMAHKDLRTLATKTQPAPRAQAPEPQGASLAERLAPHPEVGWRLVNAETLGQAMGLIPKIVRRMAIDGQIPSIRINSRVVRFDPRAVAAALNKYSTGSMGEAAR